MDRFIELSKKIFISLDCDLKSNMDRFIAVVIIPWARQYVNLKSNMDRFIDRTNVR